MFSVCIWNVHGSTLAGYPAKRRQIIQSTRTLETWICPDIQLLQQVESAKVLKLFKPQTKAKMCEAAIIIKCDKLSDVQFFDTGDCTKFFDTIKDLQCPEAARLHVCTLNINGVRIFFVSWHGRHNGLSDTEGKEVLRHFLITMDRWRKRENCKICLIGGDFNLKINYAIEVVSNCKEITAEVHEYQPTERRKNKILDYIISWPRGLLRCKKANPQRFVLPDGMNNFDPEIFDHDIIWHEFELTPGNKESSDHGPVDEEHDVKPSAPDAKGKGRTQDGMNAYFESNSCKYGEVCKNESELRTHQKQKGCLGSVGVEHDSEPSAPDVTGEDATQENCGATPATSESMLGKPHETSPRYKDNDYAETIKLLKTVPAVPVASRTQHQINLYRRIRDHKLSLEVIIDLYKEDDTERLIKDKRIVLPISEIDACIKWYYETYKGEGCRELYRHMHSKYHGIGLKKIQNVVDGLEREQRRRLQFAERNQINSRHIIDLVDLSNFPDSNQHTRYVLSVLDAHSRHLWLRPLCNIGPDTVANVLRDIYSEWGYPKTIQCDKGDEFQVSFEQQMNDHNVKVVRSSPDHPQSQGKTGHSHQNWKSKVRFDSEKDWARQLREYQRLYNTGYHTGIGMTPFDFHFSVNSQPSHTDVKRSFASAGTIIPEEHMAKHSPTVYQNDEQVNVTVKGRSDVKTKA